MGKKNLPIGVLDSGVGGLTVIKELIDILPNENIIYFGDSKRMPYGNREEKDIINLANCIIDFLENKGVKCILLACNTVSSQITRLNSTVPLFGIIEAGCLAVKDMSKSDNIGLIATVATVKSKIYENTLKEMNLSKSIIANDSRKLPKIINDQLEHKHLLNKHIKECIDPIINQGNISELILGCSHFPIIQDEIQEVYPNLKLINPANKQVLLMKNYLEEKGLLNNECRKSINIYTTEGLKEFKLTLDRLSIYGCKLEKIKLFDKD